MRQADRLAAVGRLSANMAPRDPEPLASISGAVEALARDLPPTKPGANSSRSCSESRPASIRSWRLSGVCAPGADGAARDQHGGDLDEVLLLIEHRSLPANLKVAREYGDTLANHARNPQRLPPGDLGISASNAVQAMRGWGELRVGAAFSLACSAAGSAPDLHRRHRPRAIAERRPPPYLRAVLLDQAGG